MIFTLNNSYAYTSGVTETHRTFSFLFREDPGHGGPEDEDTDIDDVGQSTGDEHGDPELEDDNTDNEYD